jgi:tyrosinase
MNSMVVNLGPVYPTLAEPEVVSTGTGFVYNPRCLKRDISVWLTSQWSTDNHSSTLIENNPDIYWFQTSMQGELTTTSYGVHAAGHFTYGGDPGGVSLRPGEAKNQMLTFQQDVYSSPGDPAFFLHHGQIDRTWWIWQNQNLPSTLSAISGTITFFDLSPSRNGTLEDYIDLGINAEPIPIKDMMSTLDGPLCYIYV